MKRALLATLLVLSLLAGLPVAWAADPTGEVILMYPSEGAEFDDADGWLVSGATCAVGAFTGSAINVRITFTTFAADDFDVVQYDRWETVVSDNSGMTVHVSRLAPSFYLPLLDDGTYIFLAEFEWRRFPDHPNWSPLASDTTAWEKQ